MVSIIGYINYILLIALIILIFSATINIALKESKKLIDYMLEI